MAEGFFAKTTRLAKSFINGAIKAAPLTMLYSAAAFGASAAMNATIGVDPLSVAGSSVAQLLPRFIGSSLIGMSLSGGINLVQEYNKEEHAVVADATPAKARTLSPKAPAQQLSMGGVTPPPTPNHVDAQRLRG